MVTQIKKGDEGMRTKGAIRRSRKKALDEKNQKGYLQSGYKVKKESFIQTYGKPILYAVLLLFFLFIVPRGYNAITIKLQNYPNPKVSAVGDKMVTFRSKLEDVIPGLGGAEAEVKNVSSPKEVLNVRKNGYSYGEFTVVPRVDTSKDSNIVNVSQFIDWNGIDEIVELNGNKSNFTPEEVDKKAEAYQFFSELDELGRPGQANAVITQNLMPPKSESRKSISSVTPPGWVRADGTKNNQRVLKNSKMWFYDRSHLIGYQLGGVNAEPTNLVTGARAFNAPNMLTYENWVSNAVKKGHIVRYQVTPIYNQDELVPRGVQMRAFSTDDSGQSVNYNVFIYNVNPGYKINYKTGEFSKNE